MKADPEFKSRIQRVVTEHTAARHFMQGGVGVCVYIWVTGPGVTPNGNPSKRLVKSMFSSNSLDVVAFDAAVRQVDGYASHYINVD